MLRNEVFVSRQQLEVRSQLSNAEPGRSLTSSAERVSRQRCLSIFVREFRNGTLCSMLVSIPTTYVMRDFLARDFN
ncbi:hypothetical protein RE6C_01976 [Rhodopirellula europaea 6C]|uniref:Uncharacterized protein n=1 Tax=Rhodopirellula europaea 6C TaxID=1263867 RepID=M2B6T3_9BACT|nr:hypothetical protein RE6C_01976 [Rhodopirellula europaea 6C]